MCASERWRVRRFLLLVADAADRDGEERTVDYWSTDQSSDGIRAAHPTERPRQVTGTEGRGRAARDDGGAHVARLVPAGASSREGCGGVRSRSDETPGHAPTFPNS